MPPDILLGPNEVFTYPLPSIDATQATMLERTYSKDPLSARGLLLSGVDLTAVKAGLMVATHYIDKERDDRYANLGLVFDKLSMLHALLILAETPDEQLVTFRDESIELDSDSALMQSIRRYGEYELLGPERLDAVKEFVVRNDPVMFDMIEKDLGSPATQEDSRIARLGCYGMVGLLVEYAWLDAAIR